MVYRARLPALYSDFRPQRTLNPDGYRANVLAWRDALQHLASHNLLRSRQSSHASPFVLDVDTPLLRALEHRQLGQPLALGTAIQEAVGDKGLIPLNIFTGAQSSIYQRTWSELSWAAAGWTARQLGLVGGGRGEDKLPSGRFVLVGNLEAASKEFDLRVAKQTSRFDRVFTKSQFQACFAADLFGGQQLASADTDVLLRFLTRDQGKIEYDGETIRIKGPGEESPGIAEEDKAIASIKDLTSSLRHQTELLDTRIAELDREAKSAVTRKNKVSALAALRSKKTAEASLSKRYASLSQLEEVASRIEQAADQVQLVNVMASSADALKSLNTQVGGVERVDSVMDQVKDQMADTDEVATMLAEPGSVAVDQQELDDELEIMERQEREKEQQQRATTEQAKLEREQAEAIRKLDELPPVPSEAEANRQQTPTSETGIGGLTLDDRNTEKTLEKPMNS